MNEPREVKIKRLKMRSMRRGIKEMDLILSDLRRALCATCRPMNLTCMTVCCPRMTTTFSHGSTARPRHQTHI